jgi:hypothetical protein
MSPTQLVQETRLLCAQLLQQGQDALGHADLHREPIRDAEFTEYVLASLDGDYDNFVKTVNNRDNPMPPRGLYSRLMYTEQRIEA